MKKALIILLLAGGLEGCASLGLEVTADNNHIQMPRYSFMIPADRGWHIQKPPSPLELAIVTLKIAPAQYQIRLIRNIITSDELVSLPAQFVAGEYRKLEREIIVNRNTPKLDIMVSDMEMGDEFIGDKLFYSMHYTRTSKKLKERVAIYLYFPKPQNNSYFIVAQYLELFPRKMEPVESYRSDFLRVLESLAFR